MTLEIVKDDESIPTPEYKTLDAAGMDLVANEEVFLPAMGRKLVGTGLRIAIPKGYEGQVRPRSGLSWNHGVTVLNAPGTIDSDYRGELKVMLVNLSHDVYNIKKGDRIAQLVIAPYVRVETSVVKELDKTERGEGGFGSTGK
jgi:dUTP pyrophosphatase